jgi:quinoprotein glucose dehydrogenase
MRVFSALILAIALVARAGAGEAGWPYYGGDQGGTRFSAAAAITPDNVDNLVPVWTFRTGDMDRRDDKTMRRTKLEGTPVLADGRLLLCTAFNEVIALDPATGQQLWRYDPAIPTEDVRPANNFNCRGVATWTDTTVDPGAACSKRVVRMQGAICTSMQ